MRMGHMPAIYPGHAGKDSGAIDGVDMAAKDHIHSIEAVLTYAISARVCDFLDALGVSYIEAPAGSFAERIERTKGCTFGVSIHLDVFQSNHLVHGHHCLYYPESRYGERLACYVDKALSRVYERARQPHPAPERKAILWGTAFPTVIAEVGFMSNEIEEAWLWNREHQRNIAFALVEGMREYMYHVRPKV